MEEQKLINALAEELHRQYRASEKAMNRVSIVYRAGKKVANPNLLMHDHGFSSCGQRKYFFNRARLIIKRADLKNPQTLGEQEEKINSTLLIVSLMSNMDR